GGVPDQVRDHRRPARVDPTALAALRLGAPGVGGVAVAAGVRPLATDGEDVVPPRPLRSVLGDVQHRTDAAFLDAFDRREGDVRRRARQHIDVEARLVGAGGEVAQRGRIQHRAAAHALQADLEALVLLVGGRRLGLRLRAAVAVAADTGRPALAARAGQVGVARARWFDAAGRGPTR